MKSSRCRVAAGYLAALMLLLTSLAFDHATAQEDDNPSKDPVKSIEEEIEATKGKEVKPADHMVTGRFVFEDGTKFENAFGGLLSQSENSGLSASIQISPEGKFKYRVRGPASLVVYPRIEGYATRAYGPFKLTDAPLDVGDLKLEKGFQARILFQTESGKPIPGVKVENVNQWLALEDRRSAFSHTNLRDRVSQADGVLPLEHMTESEIEVSVIRDGYEYDRRKFSFKAGQTVDWKLKPAPPLIGRFVDQDGKPVPGVELFQAVRKGPYPTTTDPRGEFVRALIGERPNSKKPLSVSDDSGAFKIESMRSDSQYWLMGLHKDYQPQFLKRVSSGENLGQVKLSPPLVVKGIVKGDLSQLSSSRGRKILHYRNTMKVEDAGYDTGFSCDVDDDGRFQLAQLIPGELRIYSGKRSIKVPLTESIDDLVFDLKNPQSPANNNYRKLLITLRPVADQPIKGEIQLSWRLAKRPKFGPQSSYKNLPAAKTLRWEAPPGADLWLNGTKLIGSIAKNQKLGVVEKGEGDQLYSVDVEPAGLASGAVVDADGNPIPKFRIDIDRTEGRRHVFQIHAQHIKQAQGRFALGPLPLGPEHQYRAYIQVPDSWQMAVSSPFRVTKDHPIWKQTIKIPAPVYLSGRIISAYGEPVANAPLSMIWSHERTSRSVGSNKKTDAEGRFHIAISGGALSGQCSFTIQPIGRSSGKSFVFPAGQFSEGHDFGDIRLQPSSTIRGFVLDEEGKPKPNVNITLMPMDRNLADYHGSRSARSNEEGEFEITGVERIPQRLYLFGKSIIDASQPFELTADNFGNERWAVEPFEAFADVTIIIK